VAWIFSNDRRQLATTGIAFNPDVLPPGRGKYTTKHAFEQGRYFAQPTGHTISPGLAQLELPG